MGESHAGPAPSRSPTQQGRRIRLLSRTCRHSATKAPAVVLACAITASTRTCATSPTSSPRTAIIAAAPDLFWRSVPGPLGARGPSARGSAASRGCQKIEAGEADMKDALAHIRTLPQFNGRAAAMGFCYGGPYAILGPKRLGYDAGLSCHGSQLLDYVGELDGVTEPVCIIWGDQDHVAPPPVLDAYRAVPPRMPNVEVHIFPGIQHGFMMPSAKAFDAPARALFDGPRAFGILEGLRDAPGKPLRQA